MVSSNIAESENLKQSEGKATRTVTLLRSITPGRAIAHASRDCNGGGTQGQCTAAAEARDAGAGEKVDAERRSRAPQAAERQSLSYRPLRWRRE
jgi:hypothetical protein